MLGAAPNIPTTRNNQPLKYLRMDVREPDYASLVNGIACMVCELCLMLAALD